MKGAIIAAGLTLQIGGRLILSGIDLEIPAGAFIGLLGPNGAGKTTLLRAILGLVPAASGRLDVLGRPARRGNPQLGYLPQTRSTTEGFALRGQDFVASAARGQHWGLPFRSQADRAEIAWALEQVGATMLAARPVGSLSGGERQRLLLAQALLGRPKLLLLDEPLAGLDPQHQAMVVAVVRRLQTRLGIGVLFSAHDVNPLLGAMDQVLYLAQGRAALGPVDTVISAPTLSRLYGTSMAVLRAEGRIFVLPPANPPLSASEGTDAGL